MKTNLVIDFTNATLDYEIRYNIIQSDIEYKYKTLVNGDKIYIDKDCNIPRSKLRPWCNDNNITIVHNINDATKVVLSNKTIDRYTRSSYRKDCKWPIFKSHLLATEKGRELIKELENIKDLNDDTSINIYQLSLGLLSINQSGDFTDYIEMYIADEDQFNDLNTLLNYNTIHADQVVKLLSNTSKAIMLEKDYISIQTLFQSQDGNDHNLAVEAMCNYNYDESAVYLLFLYKKFSERIRYTKVSKTVNYKSFANYFNINHGRKLSREYIIDILVSKNILTDDNLSILHNLIITEYNDNIGSKYFTIGNIQPTELLLEAYNKSNPTL